MNQIKPKVVIMMSTYNGEKYVSEQLKSIAKQSIDAEITLLVRDDGSKDDTLLRIQEWEGIINIQYIKDNNNIGVRNSFWKLLLSAPEADYYAFVDQDDIWDIDKLKIAINEIGITDEKVLWASNYRTISADGKIIDPRLNVERPILNVVAQLVCGSIQGCAMVMNRSALLFLRKFDVSSIPMHDLATLEYVMITGRVLYEPKPLFSYRFHDNNVVAKDGKGLLKKTFNSIKFWFGKKSKYLISGFALQILNEFRCELDEATKTYLVHLSKCRYNFRSRLFILNSPMTKATNRSGLRSYKIRVFLGII